MKLILFRHAERDKLGTNNPPLSKKGMAQAKQLVKWIENHKLEAPTRLACSPLLRALMTFTPVAEKLQLPLTVEADLNERQESENSQKFDHRVKAYLQRVHLKRGTLYICTHLDWIEHALLALPCDADLTQDKYQAHWLPGAFIEFQLESDQSQPFWSVGKMGVLHDH